MNQKKLHILADMPVQQAILHLAIPTMLGMVVQIFYNITDTFFVGKLNDPNQVAAVAIIMPIFMMLMALSGIFGNGGASYLSRLLGQKDYETAQQTLATAWFSCVILGITVTILGLWGMPTILALSGASEQTGPFAAAYLRIILIGSVIIMVNFCAGQLLRAEGAAKEAMFGMVIGTVTNIVLDPVFIFGLRQGVAGAAIATVIANAIAFAYYLSYYIRRKSLIPLAWKSVRCRWALYKEITKVGIPASVNQLLMSSSHILVNNIAASYGDIVVAAMGIDMRIFTIPIMLSIGLAVGSQPLIGYSYGAKNLSRLKASVKLAAAMATSIVTIFTVLFALFPKQLIRIFIQDPAVISTGTTILYAMLIGLPFIGFQMVMMNTFQAMGKGLPALLVSLSRQGIIFVPAILLLNTFFGFSGFIYAQAVADVLTVLFSATLFLRLIAEVERRAAHPFVSQKVALCSDEGAY
ncbi:putative Na+ driven multidrug efflux pump [Candidatus Vecturithrix granuli]|uniref:Multidrug export protein MepA n=1 Tax=Vecturithrix granuli TaxID=1499967 RepID=A0A081C665_VECG1|nr:putative Na+ driven multidrug efflux pump [Candidatus Vecturithrix granuli]